MTITELFTSLGIPEEKHDEATKAFKEYLDGNFIPKSRFNEVNEKTKELTNQIADRDKQLKELKKGAGDNADLKAKIEALEKANKAQAAEAEKKLHDLQLSTAIKLAIGDTAQDTDIVTSLIDKGKLILGADGSVTGLKEQVDALKESKAFLFKDAPKPPNFQPNGGAGEQLTANPFKKDTFNLTEQGRLLRADPAKARTLASEAGVTI